MKATKGFTEIIKAHLEIEGIKDPLFSETLKKPNKSIDECVNYILDTIQKSGINGCEDDYVYGLAKHYYDEDNIKASKTNNEARVVINYKPVLSLEEIEKAKQKALDQIIKEERERLLKKKITTPVVKTESETSKLF